MSSIGNQGPQGFQGSHGFQGSGAQGPPGFQGQSGTQGSSGPVGFQGAQGTTGFGAFFRVKGSPTGDLPFTVNLPTGARSVIITLIGGGGGGGGGCVNGEVPGGLAVVAAGGGGGSAAIIRNFPIDVTGVTQLTGIVGSGGAFGSSTFGAGSGMTGGTGTATRLDLPTKYHRTFGTQLIANGGGGGGPGSVDPSGIAFGGGGGSGGGSGGPGGSGGSPDPGEVSVVAPPVPKLPVNVTVMLPYNLGLVGAPGGSGALGSNLQTLTPAGQPQTVSVTSSGIAGGVGGGGGGTGRSQLGVGVQVTVPGSNGAFFPIGGGVQSNPSPPLVVIGGTGGASPAVNDPIINVPISGQDNPGAGGPSASWCAANETGFLWFICGVLAGYVASNGSTGDVIGLVQDVILEI